MKTLKIYLIKKITLNWILALGALILTMILGDSLSLVKNLGQLPLSELPIALIEHYGSKIPFWLILLLPLSALIGATFTATQLWHNSELLAICSGGLSIRQCLLPLLIIFSLFIGTLHWLNQENLIPSISPQKLSLKEKANPSDQTYYSYVQGVTAEGLRLQGTWYPEQETLKDILIVDGEKIVLAFKGIWKDREKIWHFEKVTLYQRQDTVNPYKVKNLPDWQLATDLSPRLLKELFRDYNYMSRQQLIEQSERFSNEWNLKVAAADRLGQPFSTLALLMIAIPLALSGSLPLISAIQISLTAIAFFISQTLCYRLAVERVIPIEWAIWLPLTISLCLSIPLWKKIRT